MRRLPSFDQPIDALIVGANGGLGRAFTQALVADTGVRYVHAWSRQINPDRQEKLVPRSLDVSNATELSNAAAEIDRLSLIIVTTGFLSNEDGSLPERSWKTLDAANMAESFRINTIIPALVAKHTLPLSATFRSRGIRGVVGPRRQHIRQPIGWLVQLSRQQSGAQPDRDVPQDRTAANPPGSRMPWPSSRYGRHIAFKAVSEVAPSRPPRACTGRGCRASLARY